MFILLILLFNKTLIIKFNIKKEKDEESKEEEQ